MSSLDSWLYFKILPALRSDKIRKLLMNIVLYPLGMFLLWMPTILILVSIELSPSIDHAKDIQQINLQLTNFAGCTGIFLTIAFFWRSFEARKRWYLKFTQWGMFGTEKKKELEKKIDAINLRGGGESLYSADSLPQGGRGYPPPPMH